VVVVGREHQDSRPDVEGHLEEARAPLQ